MNLPQSYGIHHRRRDVVEHLTYVDHVEQGGAAQQAGMRPGQYCTKKRRSKIQAFSSSVLCRACDLTRNQDKTLGKIGDLKMST